MKRKSRNSGAAFRLILSLSLMAVTILLVIFVCTKVFNFAKDTVKEGTEQPVNVESVVVTIPDGSTTADISQILYDNKIITNKLGFRLKSRMEGADSSYRSGVYAIDSGMDAEAIIELLQTGGNVTSDNKITIPEGYTTEQIAQLVEQSGYCSASEFLSEVTNGEFEYDFLDGITPRENRLEGYLFPDTYFLSDQPTAKEIIDKMLMRFGDFYTAESIQKAEALGYSFDEIVTIASIVESEVRYAEERPRAAGVIYNRLAIDMPLQMDSTVLYAMGLKKEQVTYKDLEVDSPYNTYRNNGLPLGPISNPGGAAIEAALNPEENDYIYYVLKDRTSGEHFYTNDYNEFLNAKEQYKANFD